MVKITILTVCLATVTIAGEPKTAAIFGGGMTGLTAALELKQAGFDVTVYEQDTVFGGKMVGYINKRKLPREHSIRYYTLRYYAFGDVIERAGLTPLKTTNESTETFSILQPLAFGEKTTGYVFEAAETIPIFIKLGISPLELQYFFFQLNAWKYVPFAEVNILYKVSIEDFLNTGFAFTDWKAYTGCVEGTYQPVYCIATHTPTFINKYLKKVLEVVTAADLEDGTSEVMALLQSLFRYQIQNFIHDECQIFHEFFPTSGLLKGPTSQLLIDPLVEYLRQLEVNLRTGTRLENFEVSDDNNSIKSATITIGRRFRKREVVNADVYIMALPTGEAEYVLPGSTGLATSSLSWSLSFQFYLPCMPPDMYDVLKNSTRNGMPMDSPWGLIFLMESPDAGTWLGSDVRFKKGVAYTMSTTLSSPLAVGGNGKTFLESTRDEALVEILDQLYFPTDPVLCEKPNGKSFSYNREKLIRTAKAGLQLFDVSDKRYQKRKSNRFRTAMVGPVKSDGKRWILQTGLYLPTPSAVQVSPITAYDNLIQGGEYVFTTFVNLPSMEHAAENGKFAAQAALEKMGIDYTVPRMPEFLALVNATSVHDYHQLIQEGIYRGIC